MGVHGQHAQSAGDGVEGDGGDDEHELDVAALARRVGGDDAHEATGELVGVGVGMPGRRVGVVRGVAGVPADGVGVAVAPGEDGVDGDGLGEGPDVGGVHVGGTVRQPSPLSRAQRQAEAWSRRSLTRSSAAARSSTPMPRSRSSW